MSELSIRMAAPSDAQELLSIYDYYVKETAITFEYDTPSVEEFRRRISGVLEKFPYLVVEETASGKEITDTWNETDEQGSPDAAPKRRILGYAYASPFHVRSAYQWCVEMSIYLHKDARRRGLGRLLYTELERYLKDMGILNLNACIGYPEKEDEHLTFASVEFHKKMGYTMVGEFHKCGFKFGRWYNMVWMEKLIGEHTGHPDNIFVDEL